MTHCLSQDSVLTATCRLVLRLNARNRAAVEIDTNCNTRDCYVSTRSLGSGGYLDICEKSHERRYDNEVYHHPPNDSIKFKICKVTGLVVSPIISMYRLPSISSIIGTVFRNCDTTLVDAEQPPPGDVCDRLTPEFHLVKTGPYVDQMNFHISYFRRMLERIHLISSVEYGSPAKFYVFVLE